MRVTIGGIEYEITVTDAMWEPVTPALIYATVNITMKDSAQAALKNWRHTPIDGAVTGGTAWPGGSFPTGRFEFTFSRPVEINQDGVEETVSGTNYV